MSALLKHGAVKNKQKRSGFEPLRRRSLTAVRSSATPRSESLRPETAVPPSGAAPRRGRRARRDFRSFPRGRLDELKMDIDPVKRDAARVRGRSQPFSRMDDVIFSHSVQQQSVPAMQPQSSSSTPGTNTPETGRGSVQPPPQARRRTLLNKCEIFRWGSAFILGFFFCLRGGFFFRVSSTDRRRSSSLSFIPFPRLLASFPSALPSSHLIVELLLNLIKWMNDS